MTVSLIQFDSLTSHQIQSSKVVVKTIYDPSRLLDLLRNNENNEEDIKRGLELFLYGFGEDRERDIMVWIDGYIGNIVIEALSDKYTEIILDLCLSIVERIAKKGGRIFEIMQASNVLIVLIDRCFRKGNMTCSIIKVLNAYMERDPMSIQSIATGVDPQRLIDMIAEGNRSEVTNLNDYFIILLRHKVDGRFQEEVMRMMLRKLIDGGWEMDTLGLIMEVVGSYSWGEGGKIVKEFELRDVIRKMGKYGGEENVIRWLMALDCACIRYRKEFNFDMQQLNLLIRHGVEPETKIMCFYYLGYLVEGISDVVGMEEFRWLYGGLAEVIRRSDGIRMKYEGVMCICVILNFCGNEMVDTIIEDGFFPYVQELVTFGNGFDGKYVIRGMERMLRRTEAVHGRMSVREVILETGLVESLEGTVMELTGEVGKSIQEILDYIEGIIAL